VLGDATDTGADSADQGGEQNAGDAAGLAKGERGTGAPASASASASADRDWSASSESSGLDDEHRGGEVEARPQQQVMHGST
jgi:hypothetical protein